MADLLITNGDATADLLAAAGVPATILPWRDMLHDGPLLPAETLERFSDHRATWLADRFGINFAELRAEFGARDAILRHHDRFATITLWLEHDLYDQLQLLQILAFFAAESRSDGLSLVQADEFLGTQTPGTILRFGEQARRVDRAMLHAAEGLWQGLVSGTPATVAAHWHEVPDFLPHMPAALLRFLEELPDPRDGLSRTERAMLEAVANFHITPSALFRMVLDKEEAAFMGDWSFFRLLEELCFADHPLIEGLTSRFQPFGPADQRAAWLETPLEPTAFGLTVLAGHADRVAANGIDRWWASTRLAGRDCWRYDAATGIATPPKGAAPRRAD